VCAQTVCDECVGLFQDPDGDHARRVLQRSGRMFGSGRGQDGPVGINVPPSIANNPNIPPDIISALQAGRLGNTVFVANVSLSLRFECRGFALTSLY
jgi:hypothetical protein